LRSRPEYAGRGVDADEGVVAFEQRDDRGDGGGTKRGRDLRAVVTTHDFEPSRGLRAGRAGGPVRAERGRGGRQRRHSPRPFAAGIATAVASGTTSSSCGQRP